jgi:peptidoglycan-associated lipoprotein
MLKNLLLVSTAALALVSCAGKNNSPYFSGIGISAPELQTKLQGEIGDRVMFMFDKSELTPEAQAILQRQAEWLDQYPNITVNIEGHADERGTREYNIALGERRADAVKKYLISLGVERSRITSISYGKERPMIAGATTEEEHQRNRRAVTVVSSN